MITASVMKELNESTIIRQKVWFLKRTYYNYTNIFISLKESIKIKMHQTLKTKVLLLWICFQWHLGCVENDIYVYIFPLDIDNKNLLKRIKSLVVPFGIFFITILLSISIHRNSLNSCSLVYVTQDCCILTLLTLEIVTNSG